MNSTAQAPRPRITKTLGHIALHYRKPEEGPPASRLLEILGFAQVQAIPLPNNTTFYQYAIDPAAPLEGDGILYLAPANGAQLVLLTAIREALRIGLPGEHAAVAALRAEQASDPEICFHVGFLMKSLEELEGAVLRVREAAARDPDLKGRVKIVANRARRGDPQIDARMNASPVFGDTPRECYGRYGCQAFIETDLLVSGPLGENLVLELDYLFPGHPEHMFNKTEIG